MLKLLNDAYIMVAVASGFVVLVFMTVFSTLLAYIYSLHSDKLLKYSLKFYRSFAGMGTVHCVPRKNGNGIWCYAEKGRRSIGSDRRNLIKQEKIVFIHGFGADKDTWPSIVSKISSKYHSIIVDLPGHGATTYDNSVDELTVEGYARSLREFFSLTGLDSAKVNLVGCSFGGAISAMFSYLYPECVENLILMCPAIKTPIFTKTCEELFGGNYDILIPSNGKKFTTMIQLLTYKPRYYPIKIMESFVNINFDPKRQEFLKRLLSSLVTTDLKRFDAELSKKISQIKNRTLVIWGKNDELLHSSGAQFICQSIENCEIKMLDECNHVIHMDQPKKTARHILDFIKEQNRNKLINT